MWRRCGLMSNYFDHLLSLCCHFCRSLLVYCKNDQTCHHYDSMNQGNIQAAKRIWNFLRISTKGDFFMFQLLNAAARVVSGTRKFDRGLTQPLHASLHWLDVPERLKYKLCMMMCRCQDGTALHYLAVHWSPVSETASRQHLRLPAS